MQSIKDKLQKFREAYMLANRINAGKAYMVPISQTDSYNKGFVGMITDGRNTKIGNIKIDVVDGSISKEYTDFNIICMTGHSAAFPCFSCNQSRNLTIKRFYNSNIEKIAGFQGSKSNSINLLGYGWVLEYEMYCKYTEHSLSVIYVDGKNENFSKYEEKWINSDRHSRTCVTKEDDKRNEITIKKNDFFYTFSFDGRLKFISDKNKNNIELRYINSTCLIEKIITSCGKKLTFKYKDNKIEEITDHIGRSVRYHYDNDFLTEVEQSNGGKYRYKYDKKHKKLNEVIDANGNIDMKVEYERYGKPVALYMQENLTWQIAHDARNKTMSFSILRYPIGICSMFLEGSTEFPLPPIFQFSFKHDRTGLVNEVTYYNGKLIKYVYDSRGNLTSQIDSTDSQISFVYDEYDRIVGKYFSEDLWEHQQYNDDNLIFKITKSNGYEKIFEYDRIGNLIETREKINVDAVAVIQYEYDSKGRIITIIDANRNRVSYIYKTDNSVFPETIEYSRAGHIQLGIKSNKNLDSFKIEREYDEVGRLIRENNLDTETRFKYNNSDLVVQTIFNNGLSDFKRYDLKGNIREVITPQEIKESNETKRVSRKYSYFYNENDVLTKIVTPTGRTIKHSIPLENISEYKYCSHSCDEYQVAKHPNTLYKYDFIGNVLEKRVPVSKNENDEQLYIITLFTYDKNSNLIQEKSSSEYVLSDEMPSSFEIKSYEYDNRNNVSRIHVNSGEDKKFIYKGIDRLVKEMIRINECKNHNIIYEYNEVGLLEKKIDLMDLEDTDLKHIDIDTKEISAIRIKTSFEYDENNKLLKITLPDKSCLNIDYDGDENIIYSEETKFLNQSYYENEIETNFYDIKPIYDKHGRIIKKIFPNGEFEVYEYDFANNISRCIDHKGNITHYKYNSINRLKELIDPFGNTTVLLYGIDGEVSSSQIFDSSKP